MEPSCSRNEASGVVDMAPLCSRSDPQRTPQTTEEKRKDRVERDRAHHAAETAEQKEHRLSPEQKILGARRDSRAAAEVVKTR